MKPRVSTLSILADAIKHIAKHGYSPIWMDYWLQQLRASIHEYFGEKKNPDQSVAPALNAAFRKATQPKEIKRNHQGIPAFTIENVNPRLKQLLQARIFASADLIKLNRENAIDMTLKRFAGWASSVPPGGGDVEAGEVKKHIYKRLQQCTYEERRMLIDQSHKLVANINQTIAEGNGAIAVIWHSHWRDPSYDYRPDHKERDGKVYLIRNSWAKEKGFVKPGSAGYLDEITQAGQEIFCRCFVTFLYSLSRLPDDMLTNKGREMRDKTRIKNA